MVPRRFRDAYAKVIIPKPRLMMCSLKQYGGDDVMCFDGQDNECVAVE